MKKGLICLTLLIVTLSFGYFYQHQEKLTNTQILNQAISFANNPHFISNDSELLNYDLRIHSPVISIPYYETGKHKNKIEEIIKTAKHNYAPVFFYSDQDFPDNKLATEFFWGNPGFKKGEMREFFSAKPNSNLSLSTEYSNQPDHEIEKDVLTLIFMTRQHLEEMLKEIETKEK